MNTPKKSSGWQKYSVIIIAISLLLVVMLAIIALAYRNSEQAVENADHINASVRLSTAAQDIKTSVYNIDIYAKEVVIIVSRGQSTQSRDRIELLLQNIRAEQVALNRAIQAFSTTLNTFRNGGIIIGKHGNALTINPLESPQNLQILHAIDEIWQPYHRLLNNVSQSLNDGGVNSDAINYATDYARIFNDRISALAEKITDNLSVMAGQQSNKSRIFLIGGFVLAILIAAYLVFIAFRQLVASDRALERSQQELEDIMDTITEGLFLLDENYRIGAQHSAELEYILRTDNIAHREFADLLRDRVSPKDISLTVGFLEQLFNNLVYEDLIKSLNPLSKIHIMVDDREHHGIKQDLYLSFNFHRVYEGDEIKRILVSVRDITKSVQLEQSLERERVENEAKLEMLSTILQVDAALMNDFLNHVDSGAKTVNSLLKNAEDDEQHHDDVKENLNKIGRVIHGLKGEASALSLESYTNQFEKIEDDIVGIRNKATYKGQDYLSLTVHLDELLTINDKARHLFERLAAGRLSAADLDEPSSGIGHYLSRFAEQIGERHNKSVNVDCQGFDSNLLDHTQSSQLREISLQLMRNAIVHGIEQPDIRKKAGKPEAGHIEIRLHKGDDCYWRYSFMDDGNGIDFKKLSELAIHRPRFRGREPEELTRTELLRFMFENGTSTAESAGEDAGRGVGMDVIRDIVKQMDGKLQVHSEAGRYTRFTIRFPEQE